MSVRCKVIRLFQLASLVLISSISTPDIVYGSDFSVMIVSGHVAEPKTRPNTVGAYSFLGIEEYRFNDALLELFALPKNQLRSVNYQLVYARENIELKQRSSLANRERPDLYIEIHHDSARQIDRDRARAVGTSSALWSAFQGFSVHYSTDSHASEESRRFAKILGEEMAKWKLQPNSYLAQTIGMQIEDEQIALYNRVRPHGLYIFRAIKVPVVVFEVGNIANPGEEELVSKSTTRQKLVEIVNAAIAKYLFQQHGFPGDGDSGGGD